MSAAFRSILESTLSKPACFSIAATVAASLAGLVSGTTFWYPEFPITRATRFSASARLFRSAGLRRRSREEPRQDSPAEESGPSGAGRSQSPFAHDAFLPDFWYTSQSAWWIGRWLH